jgi:hypothetical protein
MPSACGPRSGCSKIATKQQAEFLRPAPDGFIAHIDAALCHEVLNIPKAQREAKVQPHCLADNICWKPVASTGYRLHSLPPIIEPETAKPQIAPLSKAQVIDVR